MAYYPTTIELVTTNLLAKPYIDIQLLNKQADNAPIDVSESTTIVYLSFRKKGSTTTLFTVTMTKLEDGITGWVQLIWPSDELDVTTTGIYEAEISIDWNGTTQIIYDLIRFKIRARFADA